MLIHAQNFLLILLAASSAHAATAVAKYEQDVIYAHKEGTIRTLDVIQPKQRNGLGIIFVASGGWFSAHGGTTPQRLERFIGPLLERGYTIFPVIHGSQPRYAIPDAIGDVNRAVRFIQTNAKRWEIDPDRLGIFGGSAGGHLSLCIGLNPEKSKPDSADVVDRASGRVRAVCAWYPPTDFLNYGEEGKNALGRGILEPFAAAFEFREYDAKTRRLVLITDENRRGAIGEAISPAYHVSADDPPVLLIHGDADVLVPLQQVKLLEEKLQKANVPVKLIVYPGRGHGWMDFKPDVAAFADWFDEHLNSKSAGVAAATTRPASPDGSRSGTSPGGPSGAATTRSAG